MEGRKQGQLHGNLLIRSLKGAPLACLFMLEKARRKGAAVKQVNLEDWTGYSDKPVRQVLRMFANLGWVRQTSRGAWELEVGVWELIDEYLDSPAAPEPDEISAKSPENAQPEYERDAEILPEGGEIPMRIDSRLESGLESSSRSTLKNLEKDPPPDSSLDALNRRIDDNLAECDIQGIHEPARSEISMLLNVTPELIRHHSETVPGLGAAIWRIKNGWRKVGETNQQRNRYISGKYADFVHY